MVKSKGLAADSLTRFTMTSLLITYALVRKTTNFTTETENFKRNCGAYRQRLFIYSADFSTIMRKIFVPV